MKGRLLFIAGVLLLILGGIGVVLPIWPTTPFVLGAAGCFAGSPRLSAWIRRNRWFREYLEHYESGTAISRVTLGGSLGFLWAMLLLSAFLVQKSWVWMILLAVGLGVTAHLMRISGRHAQAGNKEEDEGYDKAERDHL